MWGIPRVAGTTIPCRKCATPLDAKRSCHRVFLTCPTCGTTHEIAEYLEEMDEKLEEFISQVPSDRA